MLCFPNANCVVWCGATDSSRTLQSEQCSRDLEPRVASGYKGSHNEAHWHDLFFSLLEVLIFFMLQV